MFGWGSSKQVEEKESHTVPEPSSEEEWAALYESSWKLLKEFAGSMDGWDKVSDDQGFTLYEKPIAGAEQHLVKTEGSLNVSVQKALDTVYDTNIETRKKWDTEVEFYNIVEKINDKMILAHIGFHTPFPVTCRDFATLRCTAADDDGTRYMWTVSVVNSNIPVHKDGKYVRGVIIVSGFVIKPIDGESDKCSITNVNQVDPKGWIPGWVVNMGKGKSLGRMTGLKKVVERGD